MSQWGARAFAEQGKSAEEIVDHYFKDITIEKIWE
jgi:stage II sporulation protein D